MSNSASAFSYTVDSILTFVLRALFLILQISYPDDAWSDGMPELGCEAASDIQIDEGQMGKDSVKFLGKNPFM